MDARMHRRIFGMLSKRLDELLLDEVEDRRDDRGKRWRLGSLLRAVVGGMLSGSKSLADVETLSTRLSRPIRGLLGSRDQTSSGCDSFTRLTATTRGLDQPFSGARWRLGFLVSDNEAGLRTARTPPRPRTIANVRERSRTRASTSHFPRC